MSPSSGHRFGLGRRKSWRERECARTALGRDAPAAAETAVLVAVDERLPQVARFGLESEDVFKLPNILGVGIIVDGRELGRGDSGSQDFVLANKS